MLLHNSSSDRKKPEEMQYFFLLAYTYQRLLLSLFNLIHVTKLLHKHRLCIRKF